MKKSPPPDARAMSGPAQAQRRKAMALAARRKEEFIGARVPRELRAKLFQRAEAEGLPVSLLMRRILEAYLLGAGEGQNPAVQIAGSRLRAQNDSQRAETNASRFSHVLGWDNITLNRDVTCTGCGASLRAGGGATLGFPATGGAPVILCDACKART